LKNLISAPALVTCHWSLLILLVADFFHPVVALAVELFHLIQPVHFNQRDSRAPGDPAHEFCS